MTMAGGTPISRQSFDEAIARFGIEGSEEHLEELFRQVQGVLAGTESLLAIDVSGVEPDMAFSPSGSRQG
jgi:Asp-tRNA(Asn)/Glu-tRNA(Gln) amidotransferase C subunit